MTGDEKKRKSGEVHRSIGKIYALYFIISAITGKHRVFSSACACLSPIISSVVGEIPTLGRISAFGLLGVLGAIIYCNAVGVGIIPGAVFPALPGFATAYLYAFFSSRLSEKHRQNAKSIMLVFGMLYCFL